MLFTYPVGRPSTLKGSIFSRMSDITFTTAQEAENLGTLPVEILENVASYSGKIVGTWKDTVE